MEVFKKKRDPKQYYSKKEDKTKNLIDKLNKERNNGLRILEELKELDEIDDD